MRRRPDGFVFTFTRTRDRERLGEPVDVDGCCLRRQRDHQSDESLDVALADLVYVPVITRRIARRRVLGQGVTQTI